MFFNHQETITDAAIKASPVAVASGFHLMNINLPDLIQYLTLFYTALLVVEKVYVFYMNYKAKKKNESA